MENSINKKQSTCAIENEKSPLSPKRGGRDPFGKTVEETLDVTT